MHNEITEADQILSMLLPNQLRRATMQFIEVEDLMSVKAQNVIKSQSAKVDAKLEALEKEERDLPIENVTEE